MAYTPLEPPCRACPLRLSGAFEPVTGEQLDFIQAFRKKHVRLPAGSEIIPEGQRTGDLSTLFAGWAFRYRTLSDGRRQILNFLLPGDFIGLQAKLAERSPHGVEALTDVRLCVFPADGLHALFRSHPDLGYDVTWLSANQELIVDENLVSVGRRSATERIAMLLVHLYRRAQALGLCDAAGWMPFPITQQHIADALGLSLVHTNKTLKRLQSLAMHEFADGKLRLANIAALQRVADYSALLLRVRPLI